MTWIKENWSRFNEWMFGWESPASTAIFRILVGTLAFVNFAMISVDFKVWFSEKGLFPSEFANRWSLVEDSNGQVFELWRINLLHNVTDPWITGAFYIAVMVACLFTALGLWTRFSQVAMVIGMITLHHRSPDILHSGDTLLRNMAILLMFADSGALYSIDRWLKKKKGTADPSPLMSVWPQRLMQLQLATLYLTTVLHKAMGNYWLDGTATWYSMNLREFERFPVPAIAKEPWAIMFTTYSTLVIELAMATLIFAKPLRKWVLISALALHAGIEYSMNIPLFAFIITMCFVNHYEGSETEAWVQKIKDKFMARYNPEAAGAEQGT